MRRSAWLLALLLLGGELSGQGKLTARTPTMSWMRWWELNREEFVAFRHVARAKDEDALGTHRPTVLKLLRRIALEGDKATRRAMGVAEASYGDQPLLRSTAAVALGRMGEASDVDRLLWLLDHEVSRAGGAWLIFSDWLGGLLAVKGLRTRHWSPLYRFVLSRRRVAYHDRPQ